MSKWKVGDEVERVAVLNERVFERFPDEYYIGQTAFIKSVRPDIISFDKKLLTSDKFVAGSLSIKDFNSNFRLVSCIQEND